jgi:15,16-dihydrobiliverdin:ferredoxin oxidoreductase
VIKGLIEEFFNIKEKKLPNWLSSTTKSNNAILRSYLWDSEICHRIRLCELEIENKFYAESLVIYPNFCYETPIFGTEYLRIGKRKYFGAIDFHPITENQNFLKFLDMFPDRKSSKTIFYDFDLFFSKKLWLSKRSEDFYNEYQIMVKCFIHQYKKCLLESEKNNSSFEFNQSQYNQYMSLNDPAFGVLKSYFNEEFAENYIHNFLFSNK